MFAISAEDQVIWGRPARSGRGRAPTLSRAQIATAAVGLADTQGIEAVSMRTVAGELGVAATSLYRYVNRKDELIELMVDAVISDLWPTTGAGWRQDLRAFARSMRAMTLRHPWMAVQSAGFRKFSPNIARCHEQLLAAVAGLGLEIDDMLTMIETVEAYVRGRALEEISEREDIRRSGLTHDAWMQAQVPWIKTLLASGEHPQLARLVFDATSPHDPDRLTHSFEMGLDRVLDGLSLMFTA